MSPSSKSRSKGNKRVEVQDEMSHNPFAAAFGGLDRSEQDSKESDATSTESAPSETSETSYRFAAKVVLRREKKGRGGKTVTRVEGIEAQAPGLEALARTLGKALGARAFVEDGQLLISGDQCQSAAKWLTKAGAPKIVVGN